MEPVAVFDRSFLHSLNREEAAIFDVMFMSNITPLFFIETLADLVTKVMRSAWLTRLNPTLLPDSLSCAATAAFVASSSALS